MCPLPKLRWKEDWEYPSAWPWKLESSKRYGMELNRTKCRVRNGTEIPALSYDHDWTDKGWEGIDFISLSQRRTEPWVQCNCKEENVILHLISWECSCRERGILFLLDMTLMSPLQGYCHNPGPFCTRKMNLSWYWAEGDQQDNVESSWHKGKIARIGPAKL